jgi:hypothetical protein
MLAVDHSHQLYRVDVAEVFHLDRIARVALADPVSAAQNATSSVRFSINALANRRPFM